MALSTAQPARSNSPASARSGTRKPSSTARRTPGQWGTTELLPSGRWRAFYRREGRKFTASRTFESKADAAAWLAAEHADRSRGVWRDPATGRITLAEFARDWLDARADLAESTRALYEHTLTRWVLPRIGASGNSSRGVELGSMYVADISPAAVRAWYAAVLNAARASAAERQAREATRGAHPARAWAQARGLHVAPTGRISPEVLSAWRTAGSPTLKALRPVAANAGEPVATNAYRALRAVLNVATADGLLESNPCQIKGAGQSNSPERGTASPAEVAQLAAGMPPRLAAAVIVAAWSGLRAGELFALARRHIDLNSGTITVERAMHNVPGQPITFGKTKTARSRRTVNLPPAVRDVLREHLSSFVADNPDALVFTLANGSPVTAPRRSHLFGKARKLIDRDDLRWHDLRHTGATLAYRAGASVPEVQRRLGHTTMRAAMTYAHAADDSDRVLADRLDALVIT